MICHCFELWEEGCSQKQSPWQGQRRQTRVGEARQQQIYFHTRQSIAAKCSPTQAPCSPWLVHIIMVEVFSCPGSSIPDHSQWLTGCQFRILTKNVTFKTWIPSDILSAWCLDKKTKKTKRQKDPKIQRHKRKMIKRQHDKNTKWQKDKMTKR